MATLKWRDYLEPEMLPHMWCPGCGNGIILGALARSLADLQLPRHKVVLVTGIGCSGKADDYFSTNALHGTHGRALAFATGIKVARPELTVIALMGDGDGSTIGGNHLIHAARRNVDITAVLFNNSNYGMTGGQVSATTPGRAVTSTTRHGNPERDFDLCRLVAAAGAVYVARSTAYHARQLRKLIGAAITKKGFAFVEVMTPCPTHFGRRNRLGSAAQMMRDLKERAVDAARAATDPTALQPGSFLVGKLWEKDDPDFSTCYEEIRSRAYRN